MDYPLQEEHIFFDSPTDHRILLAVQRQVAGLVAERDALRLQVAGLVTERDALRASMSAYLGERAP